jgi:hypothetical protein
MRTVAWIVVCLVAAGIAARGQQRNYKDRAEYDLYNEVAQDFMGSNFAKAVTDLDQWSQKYPASEFKDDRQVLYVRAYAGAGQSPKAVDAAAVVLGNEKLSAANSADMLRVLYAVVSSIQRIADPSSQQLATAEQAARRLKAFDTAPEGVTAAAWSATRADLESAAQAALLYINVLPASRAIKSNDCKAGEIAAEKALDQFPGSIQAAWFLALADICLANADPAKVSTALYELARAAALDPAKGMADSKWQQSNVIPYLEKVYTQFHGADPQGLKELKSMAVQSPRPPEGFAIKSAADIAREAQDDFERTHPELALWMKIKDALSGPAGERYFESELKGSGVPELEGTLVDARPACRPLELRVSVPLPNQIHDSPDEIVLKLETPLNGQPELHTDFHWSGVPAAFSKEPFLLTMDVDPASLKNLNLTPCQGQRTKRSSASKRQ